jgi:hypothetical protein
MVDALRRVRRRMSGTRLWTRCGGRAGTRLRSEAPAPDVAIERPAAIPQADGTPLQYEVARHNEPA